MQWKMVRVDRSQRPRPVLLAVNKPKGIVCTTTDKDRAENIVDFWGIRSGFTLWEGWIRIQRDCFS